MSGDAIEVEGVVVQCHAGDFYEVETTLGATKIKVLARRSGRLNVTHIKIVVGDRVKLEVSPYDTTRGRIVYRL